MPTAYLVLRDGVPYSTGTVLASPLPKTMTAVPLTADEWDAFREGRASWNGTAVIVTPPADPEPDPIEARLTALESALVDKGVLVEADVLAIAAPAEDVAKVRPA